MGGFLDVNASYLFQSYELIFNVLHPIICGVKSI